MNINVYIDSEIEKFGVHLFYFTANNVVQEYSSELLTYINECAKNVKNSLSVEHVKDNPNIRPFRDLYWKLGLDPTKIRLAHEALIRRILRSGLPRINPIVDLGNAVGIKYILPIGIYDLDKLNSGKLMLRRARDGEEVKLLGTEKAVKLDRRYIVLSTENNRIIHVYPHRDCQETSITQQTKNILVIVGSIRPISEQYTQQAQKNYLKNTKIPKSTKNNQDKNGEMYINPFR